MHDLSRITTPLSRNHGSTNSASSFRSSMISLRNNSVGRDQRSELTFKDRVLLKIINKILGILLYTVRCGLWSRMS